MTQPYVTREQFVAAVEAGISASARVARIANAAGFLRLFAQTAPRTVIGSPTDYNGAACPLKACGLWGTRVDIRSFYSVFDREMDDAMAANGCFIGSGSVAVVA